MKIPKYIKELMNRAEYNYTAQGEHYDVGYTVSIYKYSHQQTITTFIAEIEKLVKWVNREYRKIGGDECAYILEMPTKTEYKRRQYAVVTIYDPIMKRLEQYIK